MFLNWLVLDIHRTQDHELSLTAPSPSSGSVRGRELPTGHRAPPSICSMSTQSCVLFFTWHDCGCWGPFPRLQVAARKQIRAGDVSGERRERGALREVSRRHGPSGARVMASLCTALRAAPLRCRQSPLPSHSQRGPSHAPCWAGFSGRRAPGHPALYFLHRNVLHVPFSVGGLDTY